MHGGCSSVSGSFLQHPSVRATQVLDQEGTASGTAGVPFHMVRNLMMLGLQGSSGATSLWTLLERLQGHHCESIGQQCKLLENSSCADQSTSRLTPSSSAMTDIDYSLIPSFFEGAIPEACC